MMGPSIVKGELLECPHCGGTACRSKPSTVPTTATKFRSLYLPLAKHRWSSTDVNTNQGKSVREGN